MNVEQQIRNGLNDIISGVQKSQGRYFNELMGCSAGPDLLALKLYPNAKEMTESFGAYNAVRGRLSNWNLADHNITVFAVGDGCTPRTAALFCFRSAWTVYSIDPALKGEWKTINRLTVVPKIIEDAGPYLVEGDALIVCVHSHATLPNCLDRIHAKGRRAVIAMGCCVPQQIPGQEPDEVYDDLSVWSPKRQIKIWNNVPETQGAL